MRVHFADSFGFLTAGFALCGCLVALIPAAQAANNVGWVLVDQPSQRNFYTLDPAHSFNSAHDTVSVSSPEAGVYEIYFTHLGGSSTLPANVQVTANNSANPCAPGLPGNDGFGVSVQVICYNRFGSPADAGFSLLYQARSAPFGSTSDGLAYLLQESSTKQTLVHDSFNSTGGQNSAVKSSKTGIGAGDYTVTFGGFTHLGGNIQVTSIAGATTGGSGTAQCKVVDWSAGSDGTTATVQCYALSNGNPAYSNFSVAYAIGEPFGLVPGDGTSGAWLWAQDLTSTTPYRPNTHFQYNGFKTGAMTAQKTSTGHYTVSIPGKLNYTSSAALVTAYGPGTDYCNVAGWTGGTINVVCYDKSRAFTDSRFTLTFQTAK